MAHLRLEFRGSMVICRYLWLAIGYWLIDILWGAAIFSWFFDFLISWFLIGSIETSRMAEVKRGWRGEGRMTDDRRNIDGLVDLVLTRALVMSERQYGVGLSIVTVTDIVTHTVLCHMRWWHVSTFGPCCSCTHRPGQTPDRRPSSWGGRCRRSPSCKSCEDLNTVRRLYFATAVFALFLCEILIKFYTQWQF